MRKTALTVFIVFGMSFASNAQIQRVSMDFGLKTSIIHRAFPLHSFLNYSEHVRAGIAAGVSVYGRINDKASYTTGIRFMKYNSGTGKMDNLRFSDQIVVKRGFINPTGEPANLIALKGNYSSNYLGIPAGVNLKLNRTMEFEVGMQYLFLLNSYSYSVIYYTDSTD